MVNQKQKLTYISLFSSAGVGCYGFKLESFECIATSELIERRLKVQQYNNKCKYDSGYIAGDITLDAVKDQIYSALEFWKTNENIKDVDVVIATPPCQGMSVANHKKKDELGRNSLVIESIKIVDNVKPKVFIFENVRAFLNTLCTDLDQKEKSIKEAIEYNLSGQYNVIYEVINFKNYGNGSSRTRTVVIGVRKDIQDVSPYDLLPDEQKEKTLRQVIGKLPPLKEMGKVSEADFYHNFRSYSPHMLEWIKDIKEGQSAFDNKDPKKRPHSIVNGKLVGNVHKNGDKYSRCYWDKVGPCVHTRNDIFASQATIHPRDNRVFSIRELMLMMSIPSDFKWVEFDLAALNKLSDEEKKKILSSEEMNIRQSIGEAVPTIIFQQIASKLKAKLAVNITEQQIKKLIKSSHLEKAENLIGFIKQNQKNYSFTALSKISELANSERTKNAAYYTRQDICFSLIKDLPEANTFKEKLSILEPSVGVGNFLPGLIKKYRNVPKVEIDLVDIDSNSLKVLSSLTKALEVPRNFKINMIKSDFLTHEFNKKYDIIIGNPPFGKASKETIQLYRKNVVNSETSNMFSYFVEKSLSLGNTVALIVPKTLLAAPEYNKTREILALSKFIKIADYGEKGFKGVKIETIGFVLENKKADSDNLVKIESLVKQENSLKKQNYIFSNEYPTWLIYRESFFDTVAKKLKFDVFKAYRDRQITKKHTTSKGRIRVLKSRNIIDMGIADIKGYDTYINNIDSIAIAKFLNHDKAVLVPNLSYYPRATFLPSNSIVDGSVAVLLPKLGNVEITKKHLQYFSTDEFSKFYRIARNYGTRSLNIDTNSVFFWGIPQKV